MNLKPSIYVYMQSSKMLEEIEHGVKSSPSEYLEYTSQEVELASLW